MNPSAARNGLFVRYSRELLTVYRPIGFAHSPLRNFHTQTHPEVFQQAAKFAFVRQWHGNSVSARLAVIGTRLPSETFPLDPAR